MYCTILGMAFIIKDFKLSVNSNIYSPKFTYFMVLFLHMQLMFTKIYKSTIHSAFNISDQFV